MSLLQCRRKVQDAAAHASLRQDELQSHLATFRQSRHALLTPMRVMTLGLLAGVVVERIGASPQRREMGQALASGLRTAARLIPSLSSLIAVLTPIWMSLHADASKDPGDASNGSRSDPDSLPEP